jgi:hypothetical protein
MDWLALAIGVLAVALLLTGLITGRMPNAVIEPTRLERPAGFWSLGAIYAVIAVECAILAFRHLL